MDSNKDTMMQTLEQMQAELAKLNEQIERMEMVESCQLMIHTSNENCLGGHDNWTFWDKQREDAKRTLRLLLDNSLTIKEIKRIL